MTRFPLSPRYNYRFSGDAISGAYPSLEDAFDAGDYCLVAERAAPGSELFGAAMVMIGFPHVGLPILERVEGMARRGRLCQMLALWCLDRVDEAVAVADILFDADPTDGAVRELRRLITAERIRIAQIAAVTVMHADLGCGASADWRRCGPFEVEQLGIPVAEQEGGFRFDQPFDRWLARRPTSEQPDFILATTPQCFLPRNLADVAIPKIAYQHDSDVFIDRNWDNYRQFDLSLVATSFEHFELGRATGARCASMFQNDPIGQPFVIGAPPPPGRRKSIDILLSGSILDYSHPEKARFAFLLSRLADERVVRIVEGYLPAARYAELLAEARFLPVVSRLRGNPSPRWRDALCHGAYCLYPRDTLFSRLSRGLFAYNEEDIVASVRGHLEGYDRSVPGDPYCHDAAWRDVEETYRFFAVPHAKRLEVALKATVFMQTLVARSPACSSISPARTVWLMPFWEAAVFDPRAVATRALRMARAVEADGPRDAADVAHLAALYAALAIVVEWKLRGADPITVADVEGTPQALYARFVDNAHAILADGCRRFPDSLLLRFNALHMRLLFCLPLYQKPSGSPTDPSTTIAPATDRDAIIDCREALDRLIAEEETLCFEPRGGGFGFAPAIHKDRLFPYMRFSSRLLLEMAGRLTDGDPEQLRPLLRAALFGYRGRLTLELGDPVEALRWFERGLALDPDNLGLVESVAEIGVLRFERGELAHDQLPGLIDSIHASLAAYPVFLFRWPGRLVEMLLALGRRDEARSILDDWHRFGRSIESADGLAPSLNAAKYREMLRFGELLPERLQRDMTARRRAWKSGDRVEPGSQFERFLLAAVIMEELGIEAALGALRNAVIRLSAQPDDPERRAAARLTRRRVAEELAGLSAGIAFAVAVMTQSVWDPGWATRHRTPPMAGQWRTEDLAALRALDEEAPDEAILADADARLSASDDQYEVARWLLIVPLYRGDWTATQLPALPRSFPRNLLMFAADCFGVPEEQLSRRG